jgi:hypothetical protein
MKTMTAPSAKLSGNMRWDLTPAPEPTFSPLPANRMLTREEMVLALGERVAAGTITASDASAILALFDADRAGR